MLTVTTRQIEAAIDTLNAILEDGVDDRVLSPEDETVLRHARAIVSAIYTRRLGTEGPPMGPDRAARGTFEAYPRISEVTPLPVPQRGRPSPPGGIVWASRGLSPRDRSLRVIIGY